MEKDYVIYSLRLANALGKQGFKIKNIKANTENPRYSVFYFEDSKELRKAIKLLTNNF